MISNFQRIFEYVKSDPTCFNVAARIVSRMPISGGIARKLSRTDPLPVFELSDGADCRIGFLRRLQSNEHGQRVADLCLDADSNWFTWLESLAEQSREVST